MIIIQGSVGLGNSVPVFLISRQIFDVGANIGHDRHDFNAEVNQLLPHRLINRRSRSQYDTRFLCLNILVENPANDSLIVNRQLAVDAAVRCLDETVFIDTAIAGQTTDETDIRSFRSFNRANTAIVAVMHIANIKPGTLAPQTTRPQRGQGALVRQFGQRIRLFHEL